MPSLATLVAPLAVFLASASTVAALPATGARAVAVAARNTTSPAAITCPDDPNTRVRVWADELYSLFPNAATLRSPPTRDFQVQYHNETRQAIRQAAVFRGLPAGARGCAFGWEQEDPTAADGGVLVTGGDGYLVGRQLSGFPPTAQTGVSLDDVAPLDTLGAAAEFHPDFTNWDQATTGQNHTSGPGPIDCAETVALLFQKANNNTGHVYLKRSERGGVFIDFTCA
ncbi:hypothetical protein GGR52DRAFT_100164 [Hypoxylon sp. FL1284]|nr:hypothetical protein GGR52DRAFT_100164 [Hypoxylon sp. FL1284]